MKSFICERVQRARGNIYRLRNELIGVRRADTVARTSVSVMTRKPELSVLFPKAKAGDRIADAISGNGYYANSEGGCGYDRPCLCLHFRRDHPIDGSCHSEPFPDARRKRRVSASPTRHSP